MSNSIAPKERINISYQPAVAGSEEKELPLRLLVLSQLSPQPAKPICERKPLRIDRNNFDEVLASQQIRLEITLANHIRPADESLTVTFEPNSLKDFEPDQLAQNIPALSELLKLRSALMALKGPLGNSPRFRKMLQNILQNADERAQLSNQINNLNGADNDK